MRIRCKPWAKPELDKCSFCIDTPEELKSKWQKEFNNGKPIYLELGCGKGGFISKAASENQQKNFIAVDIKNEMLVLAKRKIENEYERKNLSLDNVRIFIKNIEQIDNIFSREDKIERIYINFCNPWPKSKHKKRRLTHYRQLVKYKQFLNGEIWFKTDDDALFKESAEYFKQAGYKIKYKTYDLHESGFEENIVTEHEQMFTDEGKKIKFLIAEPESKDNGAEEFMSSSVKELIVDGNTADKENIFKGIGITAKGSSIQRLMDYKIKYPDAYKDIMELFFKPYYGAGISHIKIESGEGSVFSSDAVKVNPEITAAYVKENTIENNSEASVIDAASRFIKKCCDLESDTEYYDLEQLVKAEQPWSGYYEAADGLWGAAHITHFIGNDWNHIKSFSAKNGTHAAFMSDSGDYTLIFVNNTDNEILHNINVINTEKADSVLYCVESVKSDGSVISGSQWFRVIDKIIPAKNKNGCFYRIDVKPHSILTCTTMGVEDVDGINSVKSSAYAAKPLDLPYNDSFNYSEEFLTTRQRMPIYTAGHQGIFDIVDFENENVLEHISDNDCLKENILCLGDKYWSNYCAKAEVMLENDREECYAGIGVRCAEGENNVYTNGCELRLYSDGRWQLRCLNEISAEGKVGEIYVNGWNQLKISVKRNVVVCSVNKQAICNYKMSEPVIISGYASLNSSEHSNKFRKLSVNSMSGDPCCCIYNDIFEGNVKYGDGWKKSENSIENKVKNAEFEFEFYGESVALTGKSEDLRLKVEIDGKIAAAGFPVEKSLKNQAFYYESGLSEKNHKVKVTVLSGKLSFSGIITDEKRTSEKKIKRAVGKKEDDAPKGNVKKSTLLIGTGLAAAGVGVWIFNKLFGKKKK